MYAPDPNDTEDIVGTITGADVEELLEDIDLEDDDIEPPSYSNYKTYIPRFTVDNLRTRLASRAKTSTRPCEEARAELIMLYREFRKSVLLVSWAAGITEAAADTAM